MNMAKEECDKTDRKSASLLATLDVGRIIAIIHRFDDVEEKWVVAPEDVSFTKEEIMRQVKFKEKYFKLEITM